MCVNFKHMLEPRASRGCTRAGLEKHTHLGDLDVHVLWDLTLQQDCACDATARDTSVWIYSGQKEMCDWEDAETIEDNSADIRHII